MSKKRRVLVTGATGNLGGKLVQSFASADWCSSVVALAHGPLGALASPENDKIEVMECDLSDLKSPQLDRALAGVDAVVHLAAQHPYPDAEWSDSAISVDMTLWLLDAAIRAGVSRFVFASSNHVMGGYKESTVLPGTLSVDLPPLPGIRTLDTKGNQVVSTAYAVTKLMGERMCKRSALSSNGSLSTVSIRIGWCQAGENRPETISATGLEQPVGTKLEPEVERALHWFRNMWLSNRDFVHLHERAILADATDWADGAIVVNGMSRNSGMPWEIESTKHLIGFEPQDDIWELLPKTI